VVVRRRRRWVILGSLLALLVLGSAIGWFVWLPGYRPALRSGETLGIDVSHHQGPIDWRRVAGDGISFAYIKASEGADFVDERFDENWSGAGAAGLRRGSYHFFSLCSTGEDQAANFLDVVHDDTELPPAVDLEFGANCPERPAEATVRRELARYLDAIEADIALQTILYIGDDFEERYPFVNQLGRHRWRLGFVLRPNDPWLVWQVGSFARVDGIDGPVGLDVSSPGDAEHVHGASYTNALRPVSCSPITRVWTSSVPS
jgi:lysozyme